MRHAIAIDKNRVYTQAALHANYIANKLNVDWDNISMAPENVDFASYPIDDMFSQVVNLCAEYIPFDEAAGKTYTDVTDSSGAVVSHTHTGYSLPIDMPDNWVKSEEQNLVDCIERNMAHKIVRDWLRDAGISITESVSADCDVDFSSVYDCLCRRNRPRREISPIGITPNVTLE